MLVIFHSVPFLLWDEPCNISVIFLRRHTSSPLGSTGSGAESNMSSSQDDSLVLESPAQRPNTLISDEDSGNLSISHWTSCRNIPCFSATEFETSLHLHILLSNAFDNIINYSRRRWRCDVLLQKAVRRQAYDRVLVLQHLGPPHLRQGQAHRHPRHLVLRTLQDQKYKRRSESTGASKGAKKCPQRHPEPATSKYEEEVIIKNEKTHYL